MKVVDVKTFLANGGEANYVFVKVLTDEGLTGVGKCTLESKELSVLAAIEECKRTLVGQNPLDIERIWVNWNRTFPWKGAVDLTAISGLVHTPDRQSGEGEHRLDFDRVRIENTIQTG